MSIRYGDRNGRLRRPHLNEERRKGADLYKAPHRKEQLAKRKAAN